MNIDLTLFVVIHHHENVWGQFSNMYLEAVLERYGEKRKVVSDRENISLLWLLT